MRAQVESALDSPTPPERGLLGDLIEECSQLSQIVDSLLFLSRTDDRRLAIARDPVNLVALVKELVEDAENPTPAKPARAARARAGARLSRLSVL